MARLTAKMTATSNHRVIDKLRSKKINYAVIVCCAVIKQPKNKKLVKKSDEKNFRKKNDSRDV